ncbi:MAG TPA: hypothetical protein PKM73_07290 [Verrucomicrobiota bacterium]|nr:hypothetical protein [Verrucomicrobiota bacterium]HNU50167.1 hypothetical protein [Verrucomicrobiota bacterium]
MDPVFFLQWPEFLIAERLQRFFPKSQGYSVLIPASRQEKGIDLALLKKQGSGPNHVITFQVKASRTYGGDEPKREATKRFAHRTWFNRFPVPGEADFILLFGLYAPDRGRTKRVTATWYRACILLFTNREMRAFMARCLTVSGQPDRMFGFGFNEPHAVFQTRGDQHRRLADFSHHLLDRRLDLLRDALRS